MNGRWFDGARVDASIYDGVETWERSKKDEDEGDEKRLESYTKWLEQEPEQVQWIFLTFQKIKV